MSFELLKRLADAHGISGREGEVRDVIRAELAIMGLAPEEDALGNLIVEVPGSAPQDAPAVLFDAHMDEIGLMISHVYKEGALAFATLGGWDERVLPAQEVTIRTRAGDKVRGVIGSKPPHILGAEERAKPFKVESLWIDVGSTGEDETRGLGIEIGDPVVLDGELIEMRPGVIRGKALDDRVGCCAGLEAIRALTSKRNAGVSDGADGAGVGGNAVGRGAGCRLFFAFTTGEEVGTRGVRAIGGRQEWAASIHLESTVAADTPFAPEAQRPTVMGKGPAITIADRSHIVPEKMIRFLEAVARDAKIPFQFKRPIFGGTNAGAMSQTGRGVMSGVIAAPTRYIHSPVTLLLKSDMEAMIALTREAAMRASELIG